MPGLVGVVLNSNTRRTNVILGDRDRVLWGKGELLDKLCGKTFAIGPHAFYQVNHDQCERLYALAGDFAGLTGDQVLLDLYCGVGTIGLTLADRCRRLIGVEVVPQAVENARENAGATVLRMQNFCVRTQPVRQRSWHPRACAGCGHRRPATQGLRTGGVRRYG